MQPTLERWPDGRGGGGHKNRMYLCLRSAALALFFAVPGVVPAGSVCARAANAIAPLRRLAIASRRFIRSPKAAGSSMPRLGEPGGSLRTKIGPVLDGQICWRRTLEEAHQL